MNNITGLVEKVKLCKNITDIRTRNLYAAAIITEAFRLNGLKPPVIVGGQAVSFYTHGSYGTIDVDFVYVNSTVERLDLSLKAATVLCQIHQ